MIDIEKVRKSLVTISYADLGDNGKTVSDYHEDELDEIGVALTELERLQKKEQGIKPLHVMQTWQCLECGRELNSKWKYCPYCGYKIVKE